MAIEVVQGMGGGEGRDLICIHGGGETPLFFEFITVMEGWVGGGGLQPTDNDALRIVHWRDCPGGILASPNLERDHIIWLL